MNAVSSWFILKESSAICCWSPKIVSPKPHIAASGIRNFTFVNYLHSTISLTIEKFVVSNVVYPVINNLLDPFLKVDFVFS